MEIFCIISNKKKSGKTYISSHIVSSLNLLEKRVCYYKPFVMSVKENKLFDIDYIKKNTYIKASDIFVSYATIGNISPLHNIERKIDERDITDLIDENKDNYDYMVFESLSLYDPIKENYNFYDLILDIRKENKVNIIPIIEYDFNIIHSTLEQIELLFQRGLKIPFIIINPTKDIIISDQVIDFIRIQINPLKVYTTNFDYNINKEKINEIKYPNIIRELIN